MAPAVGPDPFGAFYEPRPVEAEPDRPTDDQGAGPPRRRLPHRLPLLALSAAVAAGAAVAITQSGRGSTPTTGAGIARAINLHRSDLPGFAVPPNEAVTVGGQPQAHLDRCLGLGVNVVAYVRTAAVSTTPAVSSPNFLRGSGLLTQELSSSVTVEGSRAMVLRELREARAQLAGRKLQRCLGQALDHVTYTYSDGTTIALTNVRVTAVPVVLPGAVGSVGAQIGMDIDAPAAVVPLYLDQYSFSVGRDLISLQTFAASYPYPAAARAALAELMIGRAARLPH
jgi:hypothetical protein